MATKKKTATEIRDALTPTTTYVDEGFRRTALIVGTPDGDSIDLVVMVEGKPKRLGQVNIFHNPKSDDGFELLMVDVVDVDKRFTERRGLSFSPGKRVEFDVPEGGNLVASHFARKL